MAKPATTSRILIDNEAEHAELMALLADLRRTLQKRSQRVEEIVVGLRGLQQELEDHFVQEEIGGFFREAVERQPWLHERVQKLREDHEAMRGEIAGLVSCSEESRPALLWWSEVEHRFDELTRHLHHHERLEVALLQEAWTDDMGTKD